MSASLYIDTSEHLVLGLLDKDYSWIDYLDTKEKKGSGILHGLLFELMNSHSMNFKDLDRVFFTAGPGSYTGMRLGEGLCQVLEMENLEVNSFYHFEVPKLLAHDKGVWISKAFKREIFVHQWDGEKINDGLIEEKNLEEEIKKWKADGISQFSHFGEMIDQKLTLTSDMIHKQSGMIFKRVKELSDRKAPFYYRTDEKEFKVSMPSR
ncbi:MAG: hypothetical protein KC493_02135 [Bacteriovoracaceae bacterium]|nr:hypothetical protein [Bacteriovoracaceae bacterium]